MLSTLKVCHDPACRSFLEMLPQTHLCPFSQFRQPSQFSQVADQDQLSQCVQRQCLADTLVASIWKCLFPGEFSCYGVDFLRIPSFGCAYHSSLVPPGLSCLGSLHHVHSVYHPTSWSGPICCTSLSLEAEGGQDGGREEPGPYSAKVECGVHAATLVSQIRHLHLGKREGGEGSLLCRCHGPATAASPTATTASRVLSILQTPGVKWQGLLTPGDRSKLCI